METPATTMRMMEDGVTEEGALGVVTMVEEGANSPSDCDEMH